MPSLVADVRVEGEGAAELEAMALNVEGMEETVELELTGADG